MNLKTKSSSSTHLKRHMGIWQLTAFGLNYMVPMAPAMTFGIILKDSGGTVALPYILAFLVMMFIVNSYMIMSATYSSSGSLYVYVSNGINPHIGFIAGWALLLDYVFVPTATSLSAVEFFIQITHLNYPHLWFTLFLVGIGTLCILKVDLLAKLGLILLILGEAIVFLGIGIWAYAVDWHSIGVGHLFSSKPFHFSSFSGLAAATSLTVLSYLGFDAISTMSEESINPKRNIPRAILFAVIFGGVAMVLTGYIAMLVIPDWHQFANNNLWINTVLFYVSATTGGKFFAALYTGEFLLAMAVFNIVATTSCSRLLYGMGKDNIIPGSIFAKIHPKFNTPYYGIITLIVIELAVGLCLSLDTVANLVNFGAVTGFMFLNCSVAFAYYTKRDAFAEQSPGIIRFVLFPIIGNILMIWVIYGMQNITYIVGGSWLIIGIILGFVKSHGYTTMPPKLEE